MVCLSPSWPHAAATAKPPPGFGGRSPGRLCSRRVLVVSCCARLQRRCSTQAGCPSGQWERTVNPSANAYTGSNPVPATQEGPPFLGGLSCSNSTDCHSVREAVRSDARFAQEPETTYSGAFSVSGRVIHASCSPILVLPIGDGLRSRGDRFVRFAWTTRDSSCGIRRCGSSKDHQAHGRAGERIGLSRLPTPKDLVLHTLLPLPSSCTRLAIPLGAVLHR